MTVTPASLSGTHAPLMNTRLLMRASAVFSGALGAVATFLPQEILVRAGIPPVGLSVILVQIAGALYLGFAMLNWMAQGNIIGGIYSRPVAMGNLAHSLARDSRRDLAVRQTDASAHAFARSPARRRAGNLQRQAYRLVGTAIDASSAFGHDPALELSFSYPPA